ncbi:DUF2281 domain-containing protein [Nostocaceae cyanobacterium CENA357]|uniref:DUF2281 domain-containing protein n=1 Tax=Atlanticothrix silvestris CENA357 TaxID=1725252 RepID=A0A8J7HIW2_9CYAN|nr:DUF2281 domain-containing protein [Atlanticothrix silvestris]MBH8556032.1 DUF2281 domain-containing protein [Atlanticothrix silvestris CENA357]
MTIEQTVIKKLRELPPDKQQEVLDFIQLLKHKSQPKKPRRSLYGLWSDLGIEITETDIAEARQEMWGNFPKDIPL